MSKVIAIVVILIIVAAGAYYLHQSKALMSTASYTDYLKNSAAQSSSSPTEQNTEELEAEVNGITLSTDEASDLDLIAVDEDIKGL